MDAKVYVASDHRGFEKKNFVVKHFTECHPFITVEDLGPASYDPEDDFNDAAIAVAGAVAADDQPYHLGVLLCGSAHGVSMQANRYLGIRAINAHTPESAKIGREHDHANVLCLSADDLSEDDITAILKAFCHAHPSDEEKYVRRVRRLG